MTVANIFFWRQEQALGNFGDALTLLLLDRLFDGPCRYPDHVVHLIGSVITQNRLQAIERSAKASGGPPRALFWGCGKKDDQPLPAGARQHSLFLGVRGTLSRDALSLPRSTALGDTAFLLPRFYQPRYDPAAAGKVLWVPHVHHDPPGEADLRGCPDHIVRSPAIPNTAQACERFIDAIVSSRFVMANAMHAAVVALAYGVPFAFWAGSGINVPFKWRDLMSPLHRELPFHRTFGEGRDAYDRNRPDRAFQSLDMTPMLRVAPYPLRG